MDKKTMSNWLLAAALVSLPAGVALGQQMGEEGPADAPLAQTSLMDKVRSDLNDNFTYSIGLGFESMYVCSGNQLAYSTFVPEVALDYRGIYFVATAFMPFKTDYYKNEYNLSLGYALEIEEIVTLSVGGTYYWFPDDNSGISRTRELNTSVTANVLLSPTLVFNYDFDLQQREFILELSHTFDLSSLTGVEGLGIDAYGCYGYLNADDATAGTTTPKEKDGYGYVQLAANVVYEVNDALSLYAGPRFAYNNNGKDKNMNENGSKVWFGLGASWSY